MNDESSGNNDEGRDEEETNNNTRLNGRCRRTIRSRDFAISQI